MHTPIFGPFFVGRSTNLADDNLVNLYPELVDAKASQKEIGALYLTPGLTLKATVGAGPIRGMHATGGGAANSVLFVVSGSDLYQVNPNFTVSASLGAIAATGAVSMIDNGTQLAVFAGQNGYTYAPYAAIVLPFVASGAAPIRCAYLDGYGFINWPSTNRQSATQLFQSNSLDLTTWNAANFGSATGDSDTLLAPAMIRRQIVLLKEFETEFWYNAGTAGFILARYESAYAEAGIAAVESLCRVGENLMWLANQKEGGVSVVRLEGSVPKRVSTHAIETVIAGYSTYSDAIAYAYQKDGHQFYVLSFPTGNATWVYDVTASAQVGAPVWHQRAAGTVTFTRHWGQVGEFFQGLNLVGDYRNGSIYALNPAATLDNETPRKWLRSWRALPKPVENPTRFNSLRVDMQTGYAANPSVTLRWSDDGGHNFLNSKTASVGATGQSSKRVMFRRLGSTRRASGLDRIFELSSSDNFAAAIVGADVDV